MTLHISGDPDRLHSQESGFGGVKMSGEGTNVMHQKLKLWTCVNRSFSLK